MAGTSGDDDGKDSACVQRIRFGFAQPVSDAVGVGCDAAGALFHRVEYSRTWAVQEYLLQTGTPDRRRRALIELVAPNTIRRELSDVCSQRQGRASGRTTCAAGNDQGSWSENCWAWAKMHAFTTTWRHSNEL